MISGPWGHDRVWERSVIERIRDGGAAPSAVSFHDAAPQVSGDPVGVNLSGWEYAESHARDAIRSGAAYLNDEAIAKRAAQRKLFREGVREALAAAKARKDKEEVDKRAKAAAEAAARREWLKANEERNKRMQAEREAWNRETGRLGETRRILGSKWICTLCNGKSGIELKDDGYQLTCLRCSKSAWGSHDSLMKVLASNVAS